MEASASNQETQWYGVWAARSERPKETGVTDDEMRRAHYRIFTALENVGVRENSTLSGAFGLHIMTRLSHDQAQLVNSDLREAGFQEFVLRP